MQSLGTNARSFPRSQSAGGEAGAGGHARARAGDPASPPPPLPAQMEPASPPRGVRSGPAAWPSPPGAAAAAAAAPASAPASLPGSPRRASSEHVQLVRELWVLRERARVQAAERSFLADLTQLLDRGVAPRARVRPADAWAGPPPDERDVFESFPPPRGAAAPAREDPAAARRHEAAVARAQQRVTGLSPEFRARLEGGGARDRGRSEGALPRTASWGALLAQRAVSSALDSAFRHELEAMLVRRAPRRTRLYAQPGEHARDAGAAAAAAAVAHAPGAARGGGGGGGGGGGREVEAAVSALRDEVSALRNVIDAGFDIQLDIQRAIRQEVAAAMHRAEAAAPGPETSACSAASAPDAASETSAAAAAAIAPARPPPRGVRAVAGGACAICLDRPIDALLYSCGHMCTCAQCGRQLIAHGDACPICRAPVRDVVVAYMAA